MVGKQKTFIMLAIALLVFLLISGIVVYRNYTIQDTLAVLPTVAQMPTQASIADTQAEGDESPVDVLAETPADDAQTSAIPRDNSDLVIAEADLVSGADLSAELSLERPVDIDPSDLVIPDPVQPTSTQTRNEVVLRFEVASSASERDAYIASVDGTVIQTIEALDSVVVSLPDEATLATIPTNEIVNRIEQNELVTALSDIVTPTDDTFYNEQWALTYLGMADIWANLPDDLPPVTVAMIDSGICATHPDLAGQVGVGYDFVDDDNTPQDAFNHGCGVAGIIGATIDNGTGIAGIAPNVTLMPLRVLDENGVGTYADVARAVIYAVDNGADIINLSLGGRAPSSTLADAIAYADARGVQMVAAGGNNGGSTPMYPAAYAQVLSVGAVDQLGNRASLSNLGVDTLAPGENVRTLANDGTTHAVSGTSYAAAHVTGLLALDSFVLDDDDTETVTNPAPTATVVPTDTPNQDDFIQIDDMRFPVSDVEALATWSPSKWRLGFIPFEISATIQARSNYADLRTDLLNAMTAWEVVAGVIFVERSTLPVGLQNLHYLLITDEFDGCWSYVGDASAFLFPYQELNLQYSGCWSTRTIQHELGHALGFYHEHQRPDRDNYVTIQTQYIQPGTENNFNSTNFVEGVTVEYDFESVMHYSQYAFTRCGFFAPYVFTQNPALCGGSPQPTILANPGYEDFQNAMGGPSISPLDAVGMFGAYPCEYFVSTNAELERAAYLVSTLTLADNVCTEISLLININTTYTVSNVYSGQDALFTLNDIPVTLRTAFGSPVTIRRADTAPSFRFFDVGVDEELTLQNIILENGAMPTIGGAIYNEGVVNLSNVTFRGNVVNQGGGAIYNESTGTINATGGTFTQNSVTTAGTFTRGGAILNVGTMTLSDTDFIENTSTDSGGAIYNIGMLTGGSVDFVDNTSNGSGGAMTNSGGTVMISFGYFLSNESDFGGAYSTVDGSTTINNSTFVTNTGRVGGAIVSSNYLNTSTLDINDTVFSRNRGPEGVDSFGGGVRAWSSADGLGTTTLDNVTFELNSATYGGAYLEFRGNTSIINSDFTDNTASGNGGAISQQGSMTITNVDFEGNSAVNNGGAIENSGTLTADDITVSDNTAAFGGGIIVYSNAISTDITNSNLTTNIGTTIGGAILTYDDMSVTNSCITRNSELAIDVRNGASVTATNNWWGTSAGPVAAGNGEWSDGITLGATINPVNGNKPNLCFNNIIPSSNYITGIVRDVETTLAMQAIQVNAYSEDSNWSALTCTNSQGFYTIGNIPQNENIVVYSGSGNICGGSDAYFLEYWQDTFLFGFIQRIVLTSGANIVNQVDFWLELAGDITVTVLDDATGLPIENVPVTMITGIDGIIGEATDRCTDANGQATVSVAHQSRSVVFAGGNAFYNFNECAGGPSYVEEAYPDVYTYDDAQVITLSDVLPNESITMRLNAGGVIQGTLRNFSNAPVPAEYVTAAYYDVMDATNPSFDPFGYGDTFSAENGTYTLKGVPFDTPMIVQAGGFAVGTEFWDDAVMPIDADTITVTTGSPTFTADFVLGNVASVSGTVYDQDGVTPLANVPVRMAGDSLNIVCSDVNGQYTLGGLSLGRSYNILAGGDAALCANQGLPAVWWTQRFTFDTADSLFVNQVARTGVDFTLIPPPIIIDADNPTVTTDEGDEVTNSGTFSVLDPADAGLSASVGAVVNNNDGTWSWSYTPDDGPAETQTVTIDIEDTAGVRTAFATFEMTVNNIAPQGSLETGGQYTPNGTLDVFYRFLDEPSTADFDAGFFYDVDCDSNGTLEVNNTTDATQACVFPNEGTYTITGTIRDKDGGETDYTVDVVIAENDPPTLLEAVYGSPNTTGEFSVAGAPNEQYLISFYSVNSCSAGVPQGTPSLLDQQAVTLDGTGNLQTAFTLANTTLTPNQFLVMTSERLSTGEVSALSTCPLAMPTTLAGTMTQIAFNLTWQNNDNDQLTTELESSTDGGATWSPVDTLGAITATTVDGFLCETERSFRVRGVNATQNRVSAYSNVFTDSTSACPVNDAVASANVINSVPYTDNQTTIGAQSEVGDPQPSCGTTVGKSIWYSFTPAVSGTYQLHTIGSNYDAVLAVYTGTIGSLSEFACDKDSAPSTQALVNLPLTGGVTYRILVGANNSQGGNAVFTARAIAAPTATPVPTNTPLPTVAPSPVLTTVGLFDAQLGLWQFRDSNTGGLADVAFNWGMDGVGWAGVVGDWNGDGVDGIGMYRDGLWLLRDTATIGTANMEVRFGEAGWQPIVGDWNGDGTDDVGVYRDGQFRLRVNSTALTFTFDPMGRGGIPIAGDWDGINGDTVGLYNAGVWALADSNNGTTAANVFSYGEPNWLPVVGDWNEDGIDSIGGYRNGRWYLRNSNSAGTADAAFAFSGVGMPLTSYRGGAPALTMLSDNLAVQPTARPATSEPSATSTPTDSPTATATSEPSPTIAPTEPAPASATPTEPAPAAPEATEDVP